MLLTKVTGGKMADQPVDWMRVNKTLFPHSVRRRDRFLKRGLDFAHYTSNEGAQKILQNQTVWLRSTTCMNDYSEVTHGERCFRAAWHGDSGKALKAALEKCHKGITQEVGKLFDDHVATIVTGSYIACLSEHMPRERDFGRLSMWRAYSGGGVALILDKTPFFSTTDALNAYSSPVAYLDDRQFGTMILEVASNIETECAFISSLDRQHMLQAVFNMWKFAILCTKHPAFAEEREWRVTYTPGIGPQSSVLVRKIQTFQGLTQVIYELPLRNIPEQGLSGIEVKELIKQVLIGPTQFGTPLAHAVWFLLKDAGVDKPDDRIKFSNVPLRI
jgi:hypothetical protein